MLHVDWLSRELAEVRKLELVHVCLNLKAGELVRLPALVTLRLDGCILHSTCWLDWNQILTCVTFSNLSHLASRPSIDQASRQSLDTCAPSLLAFVGKLTSLELYEAPCWLGTNDAALWASMHRLTELAGRGQAIPRSGRSDRAQAT